MKAVVKTGPLRNDRLGVAPATRAASRQVLDRTGYGICAVVEQRVDRSSRALGHRLCRQLDRAFVHVVDDKVLDASGFGFPAVGGVRQDAKTRQFLRRKAIAASRPAPEEHPVTTIDLASAVLFCPISGM